MKPLCTRCAVVTATKRCSEVVPGDYAGVTGEPTETRSYDAQAHVGSETAEVSGLTCNRILDSTER